MRTRPLARNHGGDARSAELAESMAAHQRAISTHHHGLLRDVAEFDRTEAWRGDGALSMKAWLTTSLRISGSMAHTLVAAAGKLEGLPRLAEALSDGSLTLDVLSPLANIATPEMDAEIAEDATKWTVRQARQLEQACRGATNADAAASHEGRFVRLNDAQCSITGRLTKDKYALVKSALTARARLDGHVSASDPDYEPYERRLADALVEICTERGRKDGGKGTVFGGAPATMVVHVDVSLLEGEDGDDGDGDGDGYGSIQGLGPISSEVARRLFCDGKKTISLDGPDGSCLDQFPWRRDPTTAQRVEIARRDGGCRFPGCPCSTITDVHHVQWASRGGATVLTNLVTLCAAHHSRVHELGWKMYGDANVEVTFESPHGRKFTSTPSPTWRRTLPMRK
jgi:hypothetical protein